MRSLTVELNDIPDTARLGAVLATTILVVNPGAILLYGDLGAGKTTLTRYFVENLPGGKEAEVSSPSFTICNIYCTSPLVHHFDLYRLDSGTSDEALAESLDDQSVLTIVEWPDRIPFGDMPVDGLKCRFLQDETGSARRVELMALNHLGDQYLSLVASSYPQEQG